MSERWMKLHLVLVVLILYCVVPKEFVLAQQVSIELVPSPALENTQILSFTSLGVDIEGNGPPLVSATIENLTGESVKNLFLELTVNAAKIGALAELEQSSSRPFSLRPHQTVYFTNNDLANERIPGVSTRITFLGGLTPEGDDLIANLSGSAALPRDIYSLEVVLFQSTDARGRVELARDVLEVGGNSGAMLAFDEAEIYLKTPGDIAGSQSEITNPFPQFSWEGSTNTTYRLLVVEQRGQDSPESLLQSAKSSSAVGEGGSLLTFENLDVIVEGTSFQFPASGAQPLEQGKTYFWRVVTSVQGSGDTEEVSSEIWTFMLKDGSNATASIPVSQEVQTAIIELIGQDAFKRLSESGFKLESIQYDGQEFTGAAAGIKLDELLQKIRDEEIIVGGN